MIPENGRRLLDYCWTVWHDRTWAYLLLLPAVGLAAGKTDADNILSFHGLKRAKHRTICMAQCEATQARGSFAVMEMRAAPSYLNQQQESSELGILQRNDTAYHVFLFSV
jgi:hypothetical protein